MYRIEVKDLGENSATISKIMKHINYKELYNCLVAGDPKNRTKRAITLRIIRDHSNRLIEEGAMKD